jgi:uncharacterized RDD family membrane protein YckC
VGVEVPSKPPPPAPGWYADPHAAGAMRYWDGEAWTLYQQAAAAPGAQGAGAEILGRRVAAALIDLVVLTVVFVVVALVTGGTDSRSGYVGVHTGTVGTLVFIGLALLYYFAMEAALGWTVGKRALGLQVVDRASGERVGAGRIALRTVARIVDALPILYFLGFVVVLCSGRRGQRIGDFAARTTLARGQR